MTGSVTEGGGRGSKTALICVTYFMNGPLWNIAVSYTWVYVTGKV